MPGQRVQEGQRNVATVHAAKGTVCVVCGGKGVGTGEVQCPREPNGSVVYGCGVVSGQGGWR